MRSAEDLQIELDYMNKLASNYEMIIEELSALVDEFNDDYCEHKPRQHICFKYRSNHPSYEQKRTILNKMGVVK